MTNDSSPDQIEREIRESIRSPRSAAAAGIIFSLLMFAIQIMITSVSVTDRADINREWLDTVRENISLAMTILPLPEYPSCGSRALSGTAWETWKISSLPLFF